MKTANHVLVTRFNLPAPGVQSLIRAKDGWLRERVELFERYCLPSVVAQTCQDFHWLIYLDPESPSWLLDRMESCARKRDIHTVFRKSVSEVELVDDISGIVGARGHWLMTTNLDNDDAIAIDFVERVQSITPETLPVAIYVGNGIIRSGKTIYLYHYPRNAFHSVCSEWSEGKTCWSEWHTDFGAIMPVIEIGGSPAWMQVVHGSNVSNRIKGRRTSPDHLRNSFGDLLDGVIAPRWQDTAKELLIARPTRSIRDSSRSVAKRMILAIAGKEGIDRVHVVLRARTRSR